MIIQSWHTPNYLEDSMQVQVEDNKRGQSRGMLPKSQHFEE
jgi:hypothetical protein